MPVDNFTLERKTKLIKEISNCTFYREKCSSKYVGVTKRNNKYAAEICHDKQHIFLGLFCNEYETAEAYNKKCLELRGDKAQLNYIK